MVESINTSMASSCFLLSEPTHTSIPLPSIEEVLFKDDFHLIVTFRDGTVKDVDAKMFMNHERLKGYFDELRDNIELFKHPISVCESGKIWTDKADISAKILAYGCSSVKALTDIAVDNSTKKEPH